MKRSSQIILSNAYRKASNRKEELIIFLTISLNKRNEWAKEGFIPAIHNSTHNSSGYTKGCGCKYCLALYNYTQAKILYHKLKKSYEDMKSTIEPDDSDIKELRRTKNYYKSRYNIVKHNCMG